MMRILTIVLAFVIYSMTAQAYIPPYWMIMSRAAENHGRGIIQVDQEVVFKHADEPIFIHERWFIEGEDTMRVEIRGKRQMQNSIRLTYIYDNGKKYFVDENGVRKTERISEDWLEPYFHFRYSKNIKPLLVAQNIAPTESLRSSAHKFSEKNPLPPAENYVRLSRTGGVINYAISATADAAEDKPGIWIEQDQFVLRKLRLKSGLLVRADDYKDYGNKLLLPSKREVTLENNKIEIVLSSVKSLGNSAKTKELFSPSSLDFGKDPSVARQIPEDAIVKAFYRRTR